MALLRSQPLLARNTSLRELVHCQAVKTTSELELSALELSALEVLGASVGEIVVKLGRFKPVEGSGRGEDSGVGVAVPSGLLVGSGAVLGSGVLLGVGLGVLSELWVWVVVTTTAPVWFCSEAWWA